MLDIQFIKLIINVHEHYQSNNYSNSEFLSMINQCFGIKKTTFYNWINNDDIVKAEYIYENNNKQINKAMEIFIVELIEKNPKIGIKNIKNKIKDNFKTVLNNKTICYILGKNNLKHKNIKNFNIYNENKKDKKLNITFNPINNEQEEFILKNKNLEIKKIIEMFIENYNFVIHQKQIVEIMNKNKIGVKSFFKSSDTLNNFIIKTVNDNKTITVKQIKKMVFNDYKIEISMQFIYNLLKKKGYVYKKFKINSNPYSIEEQVA